jgi:hypothetical protein
MEGMSKSRRVRMVQDSEALWSSLYGWGGYLCPDSRQNQGFGAVT